MDGYTVTVEYLDGKVETFAPCPYPDPRDGVLRFSVGWRSDGPLEMVAIDMRNVRKVSAKQDCPNPGDRAIKTLATPAPRCNSERVA